MKGGGKERDEGERISSTRKDNRGINPFHVGYVALSKWATGEFIRSLISTVSGVNEITNRQKKAKRSIENLALFWDVKGLDDSLEEYYFK